LSAEYNKVSSAPGNETLKSEMEQQLVDLIKAQRKFNIEFVINHINSLASIKALYQKLDDQTYVLYETRDLQYLKIVSDSLKAHYPDSRHTTALINTFEDGMREFNTKKLRMMIDTLPEVKLDAVLKDINGRTIALSSLKGKYVLLTFWTSTSKECITENLQFKEFYRMYNKRGFEIYQISLDSDESTWKSAVRFDELPWISTREENPQSQKSAQIFNIRKVPANFLFNPQGEIIGSDLHGKALQLKLTQLFTN
jgi:peroxiredoxin